MGKTLLVVEGVLTFNLDPAARTLVEKMRNFMNVRLHLMRLNESMRQKLRDSLLRDGVRKVFFGIFSELSEGGDVDVNFDEISLQELNMRVTALEVLNEGILDDEEDEELVRLCRSLISLVLPKMKDVLLQAVRQGSVSD